MIEISFAAGMVTVTLGWLLCRFAFSVKKRRIDWKYEAKQLIFLANLLVLARITFYPMATVNGQVQPLLFEPDALFPLRVNLIPFVHMLEHDTPFDLLVNLIGNCAMFIPTGIMLPLIYKKVNTFRKTLLTGAAISFTIELLQLPFAVRASDVDDLILNTAGCVIGYGILTIVLLANKKKLNLKRK